MIEGGVVYLITVWFHIKFMGFYWRFWKKENLIGTIEYGFDDYKGLLGKHVMFVEYFMIINGDF